MYVLLSSLWRKLNHVFFFSVLLSVLLSSFAFVTRPVLAQSEQPVLIQVFVREGCQHCADEEKFLAGLREELPHLRVEYLRLEDPTQRERWVEFTDRLKIAKVTPLTVIGDRLIIGFDTPDTTGTQIRTAVVQEQQQGGTTNVDALTADNYTTGEGTAASTCIDSQPCSINEKTPWYISLPWGGKINVENYPIIALSAVLGLIDGFNPCAMWVLITFLMILLKVGSKKKMLQFAGVFILAEAIMYYSILMIWFQAWDFVQLDAYVTPIVGLVAIGGGIFFLYEAKQKGNECKVVSFEQHQKTREKLQELVKKNFSLVTIVGILGLAFSVNIIEFACSIGIPQAFTKILEMNNFPWWQNQLLVLLYILFYMVDDFIVFGIAFFCIDKIGLTHKYAKASNWIGGLLMLLLGLIMLLKPELLVF